MNDTILPGSTIGVLGSGQLGRMFTIAARRLGYRVHVLSPDDDTPAGQVADVEVRSSYLDLEAVERFARTVDVVTFEFENVPVETVQVVERYVPVRPGGHVLHTTQNRRREKQFLRDAGLPVTRFHPVDSLAQLQGLTDELPGVLKTAAWGYDGKGQAMVTAAKDCETAWETLRTDQGVLERWVDFQCELSVVAARGRDGNFVPFSPIINSHANHILDVSVTPADLAPGISKEALEITRTIFEQLDVVGVLCVEFFLTRDGRLLVNEMAPRPHNSGHLTVDAHVTCQFEQQVRAVCGLPLGSARQLRPAAMANLLGEIWLDNQPRWAAALSDPAVKLHLYGKREPRAGRKMGHITAMADSSRKALALVQRARQQLSAHPGQFGETSPFPPSVSFFL
jgi:5-(carboxyamino)imidazole ribonucleotide synthase